MLGAVIAEQSKLYRALLRELKKVGTKERAQSQQRYMKSTLPFAGVAAPQLRLIQKSVFADHVLASQADWQNEVLRLFRDPPVRELRYVAIELAYYKPYRKWLTCDVWDMLDELVVTGAWWDIVDALAPNHYNHLLNTQPRLTKPLLRRYATDKNLWRRRVSILSQLKAKTKTDETLLFSNINKSLDHTDFFVRKAIGWALRAHSRTNPQAVIDYVEAHKQRLSPLSQREALKVIKQKAIKQKLLKKQSAK